MDWLNGPLVWAIDDWHQPLYLFPRDCPRVLLWPTATTTAQDRARHWRGGTARMMALVEQGWLDRIGQASLFRYALPGETFEPVEAGMWVSRDPVTPAPVECLTNLPRHLAECDVMLTAVPDLRALRPLWETSLHASGIRLRNAAQGWP